MPRIACPRCRTTLSVPDDVAGKRCRCPKCSDVFRVPALETSGQAAPTANSQAKPAFEESAFPVLETESPVRRPRRKGLLKKLLDVIASVRKEPNHEREPTRKNATPDTPPPKLAQPRTQQKDFLNALPLRIEVFHHPVTFSLENGRVVIEVAPDKEDDSATDEALAAFLNFYLATPIGRHMLTPSDFEEFSVSRSITLRKSFLDWFVIDGPRDKKGRLRNSVDCIAYPGLARGKWPGERCRNPTKDPSGLCRYCKNANVEQTLWTFDPHAGSEAAEAEREVKRTDSETKWKDVAAGISYKATDRQIFYLLDLGAKPEQLEGIGKRAASRLIDEFRSGT